MTTVLRRTVQGQRVTLRSYPKVGASVVWEVRDEADVILGTVERFYPCWWWAYARSGGAWSSDSREGAIAHLLLAGRAP